MAQNESIRFVNLSTEQGLSQSTVNAILQDRQGFLWFATEGGLNRYDGYQFTAYQQDPDDPASLSNDIVQTLFEDQDGSIWIGTSTSLDQFDPSSGRFIHYGQALTGSDILDGQCIPSITGDLTGRLWIGTCSGLVSLDPKTHHITSYKHDPGDPGSLSNDSVQVVFTSREGELWVGTDGGLDRFDRQTGTFAHPFRVSTGSSALDDVSVRSIIEDPSGLMWIGSRNGLFRWDPSSNQYFQYRHDPGNPLSLSDDSIRSVYRDTQGALWVGTLRGLNMFDEAQGTFTHFLHDPNDPYSMSSDYIRSIFEDRSGVLWIGTSFGGLDKYARSTQKFTLYNIHPGLPDNLSDNNIWSVYEDQSGNLWIGTFFSGLNKLDQHTGKVTIYRNDPADSHSPAGDEIRAILQDGHGGLWIGMENGGLERFDPDAGTFTRYQYRMYDPASLSSDHVSTIGEDQLGRLWIGTYDGGLNQFIPSSGTFIQYRNNPNDPTSLSNNDVRSIYANRNGALWVGTFGGLNQWSGEGNHFTIYRHDPDDPSSLSNDVVSSIYEDKDGTLWVGTFGGGLNRFNGSDHTFTHFTRKDGLPDDTVFGILTDADGNLWLSTNKGISNFNPRAGTFRNYDISDGLQGNQFNPGAAFQARDGEMFFGGTKGLNAFFPEQVKGNPIPPPVVITAVMKYNQVLRTNLGSNETLQLSYRDNFISFEFAALDFNAPEKNQYAYKLEGVDKDWVYAGTRHYASYANLRGGDYIFQVKAANNDGVWAAQPVTLQIHITPPFWQTWWFLGIIGFLVISGSIGGYRWRVSSVEARNRELVRRVDQRTHELATLNTIAAVVNRSLDLPEILNAALEKTLEIMNMDIGLAYGLENPQAEQLQGPFLKLLAHRGVSDSFVGHLKSLPFQGSLLEKAARIGTPIVHQGSDHPFQRMQAAIEGIGIKQYVVVPLLMKEKVVGGLSIGGCEARAITEDELSLLEAIGQQVGMAVMNARLYERAEQRSHELATLNMISEVVNRSLDLPTILNDALDKTLEVVHLDIGLAFRLDEPGSLLPGEPVLTLLAHRGVPENYAESVHSLPLRTTLVGEALEAGRPVVHQLNDHPNPQMRQANEREGIQLQICVPLLVKGTLVGMVFLAAHERRTINPEELSLLAAIGQQVGMAVENARLYEQAEQTAVASERGRLARELHDSVAQLLYSVTLYAEAASELLASGDTETASGHLHDLRDTAQEALREMRLLIFELHRPASAEGLAASLQARLEAVEKRGGMQVDLQMEGKEQISRSVQAELYNIAHEALNNALKHAHANSIQIRLLYGEDTTDMEISDDGIGFEPSAEGQHGGFGLPGMQERARKIGGELQIVSAKGQGTRVIVKVPVNPDPHMRGSISSSSQKGET